MKKILLSVLCIGLFIIPSKAANAEYKEWYMNATNTKIIGQLYSTGGDRDIANASTINKSENGYESIVKIYATYGGTTIPSSWKESTGYPKAWVQSTAASPEWWGSAHSTNNSPDPYNWLNLYVGNL